ncbi:MAG: phosphoribosyltransferase [Anaerolineae bacterium]|nr:phosphoribosyltransferase [Anaerolineae bacterium]
MNLRERLRALSRLLREFRPQPTFTDRAHAGRMLAALLKDYAGRDDVIVLALPRGGVPVAAEVAKALNAPLDVFLVRKLGVPGQPELAMGALASGNVRVLWHDTIRAFNIGSDIIEHVTELERRELERREQRYRAGRPAMPLSGRTVILVDDGIATGASMLVAVRAVYALAPRMVIVAAPVASPEAVFNLQQEADEVVCCLAPEHLVSIGSWYQDFKQLSDEEVLQILDQFRQ